MYRCSAYLSDFEEDTADKAEESGPEENKEDNQSNPIQKTLFMMRWH
jgi:hypothetical protein